MTSPDEDIDKVFSGMLSELSDEFDKRTIERHKDGATRYGSFKFMVVDTIDEALEEIIDLGNYARYTFIKLRLLQERIRQMSNEAGPVTLEDVTFVKAGDMTKQDKA